MTTKNHAASIIRANWDWERNIPPAPGWKAGNTVYLSGQIPYGPDGNLVGKGDMAAQADRCFANMRDVLGRVGGTMNDVVKMTTYFTEPLTRELAERYWVVRARYFGDHRPASTGVQVQALLDPDMLLEIDAIAVLSGSSGQ